MAERRPTSTVVQRAGRLRQSFVFICLLAALVGLVLVDRSVRADVVQSAASRPAVAEFYADAKASTWFCPGIIGNDDQVSGTLVISNAGETPVGGTITRFVVDGVVRQQRFAIPPRSTLEVDALAGIASPFVSAMVESQGAPLAVEQRTSHRAGDAVAACASTPSGDWFLADGFTGADSIEQVVVTNPALDSAILAVTFVTAAGERSPQSLKGVVIPPQSVRVFEMASLDARNEAVVAVSVRASVGRVVVGRSQHYLGRGRLGYTMSLAASSTSNRWYFADGDKSPAVSEEFVIYNPSATDQQLTFILADDAGVAIDPIAVTAPAKRVTKFAPTGLTALPDGRYSAIISSNTASSNSTDAAGESVVIERVSTRTQGKSTASAIVLGAPSASRRWIAPSGVAATADDALRLFNPGALPATFRITYLGPAGDVPVAGYEEVSLAPGASTSVMLPADSALGTVSVSATEPIVVQRRTSRGAKQPINGAAPLVVVVSALATR